MPPGDSISDFSHSKDCYAPGQIIGAPGLKNVDTPAKCGAMSYTTRLRAEQIKGSCSWLWNQSSLFPLTLPMRRLYFCTKHKDANIFRNHLNHVMLVLIRKPSLSTLRWVPVCQGFSHFLVFLHHFALAKLATSSIGVNAHVPTRLLVPKTFEISFCADQAVWFTRHGR